MKYFDNFNNYIIEKVNVEKYLPKISKVKSTKYKPEIKAMLDVIAFAEGTWNEDGYKTQFTGKKFNDFSDHPRELINYKGLKSTAAGRYQFLSKTWDDIMKGEEFTPEKQDEGAYKLLKRRKMIRPLLKGDIKKALYRGRKEWASFPWSPYGQHAWFAKNDEDKYEVLKDLYWNRLKYYKPSAKIPNDLGEKTLDNNIEKIKPQKIRKEAGYTGGDDYPFIVGSSNGENVKKLQVAIVKLGGELPVYGIDGKFGPETMGASKYILSKLKELGKYNKEETITNELDKENIEFILKSAEDNFILNKINDDFKKVDYKEYSENLPLINGVLEDGKGIYNVESISNFISKLKEKKDVNIYHLGDTHIKSGTLEKSLEKSLENITVINYNVNAEKDSTLESHIKNKSMIQKDLDKYDYDLIILSLSVADVYIPEKDFNMNKFKMNYNSLINIIKDVKPNIEILIITPFATVDITKKKPNTNSLLAQSACYDIADKQNVALWDIFKKMGGVNSIFNWNEKGLVKNDGIHLNRKGYKKIASIFIDDLKNYIK